MSLTEMLEESDIKDAKGEMDATAMVKALGSDNEKVIEALSRAYLCAEKAKEVGISNFLQDRVNAHAKWGWMLRATGAR